MQVKEAIERYLDVQERTGVLSAKSARNRRYELNRLDKYCQKHGIKDLARINRTVMREYFASLRISNRTRRSIMAVYNAFFTFCVDEGFILENPIERIKIPKTYPPEPDILTQEELRRFFQSVVQTSRPSVVDRNLAMMALMNVLCLRVSEVIGLRLEDLELPNGTTADDFGVVRISRKGGKETRLPLNQDLYEALMRWLEQRPQNSPWVFPSSFDSSQPLSARRVHSIVAQALRRAGIVKRSMGPHLLRHTGASRYVACGMDIRTVQHMLGHSSLVTTSRYIHLVDQMQCIRTFLRELDLTQKNPLTPTRGVRGRLL